MGRARSCRSSRHGHLGGAARTYARGRKARSDLKVGICGEHGGDPASVAFFRDAGLDYVSCSLFRMPVARLAAAQAALKMKGRGTA